MKDTWLKDIHDRLGDYGKEAPEGLWEGINDSMPKVVHTRLKRHREYPNNVNLRVVSIVAAACIAIFVVNRLQINDDSQSSRVLHLSKTIFKNKNIRKDNSEVRLYAPVNKSFSNAVNEVKVAIGKISDVEEQIAYSSNVSEKDTMDAVPTHTEKSKSQTMSEKQSKNAREQGDYSASSYHFADSRASRKSSSRWSISTGALTAMGSSSVIHSIGEEMLVTGPQGSSWEDNPLLGIGIYNQGMEVETEIHHKLPIRVGINVAYAISRRLSIESGFTYTRLTSDMRDGSRDNYYYGEQQLDYVGLPINLKYKWMVKRYVSVYSSAGLLMEKCVSGKMSKNYIIMGETKKAESVNITSKPFQLSANVAAGVQLNVTENVGIYAEPGMSYYFDDRSSLKTIYKEKPFNFNLNVGLRFSLNK